MKKLKKSNLKKKQNFLRFFTIGIWTLSIILAIIAGVVYVRNNPAFKNAIALATTVKPETFTELYFEDHVKLPSSVTPPQESKFKFTIHNLENKDMNYPYEVYAVVNEEKQIIDSSKVLIKTGEYRTIPESFKLDKSAEDIKIAVVLTNKNQEIFFWANKKEETIQVSQTAKTTQVSEPNKTAQVLLPNKTAQAAQPQKAVEPKLLTDFYFQLPLPILVTVNQANNFAFTVHNPKDEAIIYPYEVTLEENGIRKQIDKGEFTLTKNGYKTIPESFTITTFDSLAKVTVKLINENRYIYFETKGVNR